MITKISFLLVMLSGVLHPLWNMLLKKSDDKVIFYLNIHIVFTVLFCFVFFFFPVSQITLAGWSFVALSAFAHFFYQLFLCRTYELADMSLAYPVTRSSPIVVLLVGACLLKEIPSPAACAGIIIVMMGVLIINQKRLSFSSFSETMRNIDGKVMWIAGLTAFSSAGYSVIDKKGVLMVHPILFFYLMFALSGLFFLIYMLFLKERRRQYFEILSKDKYRITLAALLEFSSYILILYAFRISNVAYIVSLRQISVVFGALYGIWFLKEKYGNVRFVGSMIIFCGIFLITAFG